MADLERGMVDPDRSLIWNLWHYRGSEETREWSTAHHHMYDRVMACRVLACMSAPIVGFIVLVGIVALIT